ncbi:MAG: ABC transporter permease [Lentisphaerae bacterium]|nr:ABC transporter permease [Lentisphaerota bacterium]
MAIGSLVGSVILLRAHDARTEKLLERKQADMQAEMDRMEDDYRRIMRKLGHNVMILHEKQSLVALQSGGSPAWDMPVDYTELLARSGITTLNHLLPVLQGRMIWPEHELEVLVYGTPGQVPVYHRKNFLTPDGLAYRDPIVRAVPPGMVNIGGGVARELGLRPGDEVVIHGETMIVNQVAPVQGARDDLAVWCDLKRAQAWLGRPGRINVIFALECVCHIGELGRITDEVRRVLPDTQVVEFSSRILVRAEARERAAETSRQALESERENRRRLGAERRRFALFLIPLLLLASGFWVFFLILGNVRERRQEIGVWRALGVRSGPIAGVFVVKAALIGLLGALAGYPLGLCTGAVWGGVAPFTPEFFELSGPGLFAAALLIALALCVTAGLLPSMLAAEYDPAEILRDG